MSGSGELDSSGWSSGEEGSGEEGSIDLGFGLDDGSGSEEEDKKPKLFDPTASSQFPHMEISIEQFLHINLEESETYENLTELLAEFQLFQHGELNLDGLKEVYGDALENLLHLAPNLKILHPVGGHFYFPSNGTIDQVESELQFVQSGINALTFQMRAKNLTLSDDKFDYIKYTLYLVIDGSEINETLYFELLEKIFGSQPLKLVNKELGTRTVSIIYDANEIYVKLDINLFTDPSAVAETKLETDKRIDYKQVIGLLMQIDRHEPVPKTKEQILELLS
ncbi:hypothetical protein M3Y97_00168100 [Aphelenchoides bicaudatus]|nr:hypothetical protein M3Y97_00168100 [Aphelenchoides bicaudatus]